MSENIDAITYDLIIGFLTKNNTLEENSRLYEWLKLSEENKKEFFKIKKVWQLTSQTIPPQEDIVNADLEKVHARLNIRTKKTKSTNNKQIFIGIAASIILLFGLWFTVSYILHSEDDTVSKLCRIVVPKGAKSMAQLPDGSTVWLNAESTLTYNPNNFDKESRRVHLDGEGYFSVTTNPKKPFIVESKNIKVKAYGTEFNVKSYPEDVTIETTLIHGIVKVEGENLNNKHFEISIKPKQKLVCYTKPKVEESSGGKNEITNSPVSKPERLMALPKVQDNVNTVLYTSWKDEKWIIEGEKIGDLAVKLERRFNVDIRFDSEDIKNYMFTGTFRNETLEQVMQIIKLTAPIYYKIGKGEVVVYTDKRLRTKYEKYINN